MMRKHALEQYLEIGDDGRIRVYGTHLQRELFNRPGQFTLMETSGDSLVFSRVVPGRDMMAIPPGRVFLTGEFTQGQPPINVINYIHGSSLTCWVVFSGGAVQKSLIFRKGRLVGARSNLLEDRLGEVLVRYGAIRPGTLQDVLQNIQPGRRVGAYLLENGIIDGNTLWTNIKRQMEEIFLSVLNMQEGSFSATEADTAAFPESLALDVGTLLLECLQRTDEMAHFKQHLPGRSTLVARRPNAIEPGADKDKNDRLIYRLLDKPDTIAYLARRSFLGEYETTKSLFRLLQSGVIEVLDTGRSFKDDRAATIDAYNRAFQTVAGSLREAGLDPVDKLNAALKSYVRSSRRFNPFSSLSFGEEGTLDKVVLLQGARTGILQLPNDLQELLSHALAVSSQYLSPIEEFALWTGLEETW